MEEKQDRKKYWLKLDKDFLKSPQIKVIKNMPNGKDYIIFYLSLMLESVETVGHLRFTSLVPYNDEMLSAITDTNIDIVRSATKIFCELGMMQIFDDGTIFMTEVPKITGKECESAERVRRYRLKQQEEKDKMLQCNANVTKSNAYIEKDKEKDKEIRKKNIDKDIEIEKDIMSSEKSHDHATAKEIIDYLNLKTGKHFKYTKNNINKIKTRLKENFTLDDFKIVIDKKTYEWLNDDKMNQYLRPETLFGSKFESYLQQEVKKKSLKDLNIEEIKLMKGDDYGKNTVCRANENIDYGIF